MINKERAIKTFFEYVRIDSESGNEKAICERLIKDIKQLGHNIYVDNSFSKCKSNGNNVYCFIDGTLDARPILFSAHMDTVKPGVNIEPYIDGNYIKSKGDTILGADDKSGVVAIMEALRTISEKNLPHRPIEVVFTISEEIGLCGAKNLDFNSLKSKNAIVIDSSGNAGHIKIQAPGKNHMIINITGVASHAGANPEKGISAIMVASEAISNMKLLRIDSDTTANIGSFIASGTDNTVCQHARVTAEARSLSVEKLEMQTKHIIECFEKASKKYNAKLDYKIISDYHSYKLTNNSYLVNLIKEKCKRFNIDAFTFFDGGGSDANVYNSNGIETVAIGSGMDFVHTSKEQLNIKDFITTIEVIMSIMTEL